MQTLFTLITKQAILMRGSTVLSLQIQLVFPGQHYLFRPLRIRLINVGNAGTFPTISGLVRDLSLYN
jgi:hypothetical protein